MNMASTKTQSKKSLKKSTRRIQNNQLPTPSSRSISSSSRGITQKRVLPSLSKKSSTSSKTSTKTKVKNPNTVVIAFQSRYERVQNEFKLDHTLEEVLTFFKNKLHLPSLLFSNTFINGIPKKQFKLSDKGKTLMELGIVERTAFLYQD